MDDILKVLYPEELKNVKLKNIFRPFCSSANKVLLDYKAFKKFIKEGLEGKPVSKPIEPKVEQEQVKDVIRERETGKNCNLTSIDNPMKGDYFLKHKIDLNKLSNRAKQAALEEQLSKRSERITRHEDYAVEALDRPDVSAKAYSSIKELKARVGSKKAVPSERSKSPACYEELTPFKSSYNKRWLNRVNESLGLTDGFKIIQGRRKESDLKYHHKAASGSFQRFLKATPETYRFTHTSQHARLKATAKPAFAS